MQTDNAEILTPVEALPLLPIRGGILLPGTVITLPIGRRKSLSLIDALPRSGPAPTIAVGVQRDARVSDPTIADLQPFATLAQVVSVNREAGSARIKLKGLRRVAIRSMLTDRPFWKVETEPLEEPSSDAAETRILADALVEALSRLDSGGDGTLSKAIKAHRAESVPGLFADRVAASLNLSLQQSVNILLTLDVGERLRKVTEMAGELLAQSQIQQRIQQSVRDAFGKQQRESVLRQQMKAIRKELGEEEMDDAESLRTKLDAIEFTAETRKVVDRELNKLDQLNPGQSEYNVTRTWLEVMADLPWNQSAPVNDDIVAVATTLDADHYGLEDVKERILEHMAVLKLSGNPRGTILCLAGPPGTGKTSLARSIADATGRPFVRIALGGVRDEASIRGHRKTYVGAMPGRLINGLRKAGARNPVMLLDEIDKLAVGHGGGSPENALLEVLDPEQNKIFVDHYLEQPFDLSEVLFICTANFLGNLSSPLRDRLEIVEIDGYTYAEKKQIAIKHLLPRQLKAHGVSEDGALEITDDALEGIIRDYTREAGVRQLEREIIRLCRASALEVARGKREGSKTIDAESLAEHLGKKKFSVQLKERTALPGVATGLAWTQVGGDILFIETSRMPGKGRFEMTGQLGDVMKESARAALTFVRSNAERLGVNPDFLAEQDLHIHFPAGGVPKDGPSAGVTVFTALTSLLTGRRVRSEVAMTGECTLRGRVLPVGGIKSKVLAAHRAGIEHVILPKLNERDLDDVPEEIREQMNFTLAEDMFEVLEVALEGLVDTLDTDVSEVPIAHA